MDIKGIDGQIFKNSPPKNNQITMEDIAKCKGSNNFAVRFIGQISTLLNKGTFITDEVVSEFMHEHYNHLNEISGQFKKVAVGDPNNGIINAKELKSDQKMTEKLAKLFDRASEPLKGDASRDYASFQSDVRFSHTYLNSLHTLENYKPLDLLKAVVYEQQKGRMPEEDIKHLFFLFIKDKPIKTNDDLKKIYSEFIEKELKSEKHLEKFSKDRSLEFYIISGSEFLDIDSSAVRKIDKMPLSSLLTIARGEKEDKQKDMLLLETIQQITNEKDLGEIIFQLFDRQALREILDEVAANNYQSEMPHFIQDYRNYLTLTGDEKTDYANYMVNKYIKDGSQEEINITKAIRAKEAILKNPEDEKAMESIFEGCVFDYVGNVIRGNIDEIKKKAGLF